LHYCTRGNRTIRGEGTPTKMTHNTIEQLRIGLNLVDQIKNLIDLSNDLNETHKTDLLQDTERLEGRIIDIIGDYYRYYR
jgi:hypothetical protein